MTTFNEVRTDRVLTSAGSQPHRPKCDRMNLRHALFVADTEYKKQKKPPEGESDLDEDTVVEQEELCKL